MAQRHHERRKLVGTRLEVDPARSAEWAGTAAQRQSKSVPEQLGSLAPPRPVSSRRIECRIGDGICFKLGNEGFGLLFGAGERSQTKSIAYGEDNPFPASRVNQLARGEGCGRAHRGFPPSRTARSAST